MINNSNKSYFAGGLALETGLLPNAVLPSCSSGQDRHRLEAELTHCVYWSIPLSLLVVLICSSALLLILAETGLDATTLVGWYLAVLIMMLLRWQGYRRYTQAMVVSVPAGDWARYALIGAVVSGIVWGALPLLLWPAAQPQQQAAEMVVLAGISAGGAVTLAPLLPAALAFLWLALPPLVARLLFEGDTVSLYLAGLSVVYLLAMSAATRRMNILVETAFTTRYQREQAEAQVKQQAFFDALTGLANRRMLHERLQEEHARARRHGQRLAVHFLDLDNFKTINDSLGHQVGDLLLKEVARRLQGRVREEDLVARLGGDEFVIVQGVPEQAQDQAQCDIERLAQDVRRLVATPYRIQGHELHLSTSIGIAVFPDDGDSVEELMQHADAAMYKAKDAGRDAVRFFLPDMQAAALRRLDLVKALRAAIREDRLEVHYQPQVDLAGRVVGLEALVRWTHPEHGPVSPGEFVPVAEESGLIFELHDWIQKQVCCDIRRLQDQLGAAHCPVVSLNLSPLEFRRVGLVERLQETVRSCGIAPALLRLEITEGAAMENIEQVIPRMEAIRLLGIGFSIDDFGTGYSSLAYLKRLPVDSLKIDRSFVLGVLYDPSDAVLVETIINMAHNLGIATVAEGVEDEATRGFLAKRGCDYFQGWHFGRAQPLAELQPLLRAGGTLPAAALSR